MGRKQSPCRLYAQDGLRRDTVAKKLADFETKHGGAKIGKLERSLATERAKVEALSGIQNKVNVTRVPENVIRFGIMGDLHIGSMYAHEGALTGFLDRLADDGIEDCYVTGDVLEGHRVFRGQEFEVRDVGLDAQLNRLHRIECNPNVSIKFITGNHDASFKNECGVHVGKAIEQATEWKFLGEDQARIRFDTPAGRYELMLLHPGGGSSYALSYRPQKIAEQIEGGNKPHMIAIGHYHKAEMMPSYRNICMIQSGTFCKQTPFMARQGLAAHVGGWIVEVQVGEVHNSIKAEFVAVYV
jgi:hypothetical protein